MVEVAWKNGDRQRRQEVVVRPGRGVITFFFYSTAVTFCPVPPLEGP